MPRQRQRERERERGVVREKSALGEMEEKGGEKKRLETVEELRASVQQRRVHEEHVCYGPQHFFMQDREEPLLVPVALSGADVPEKGPATTQEEEEKKE